LTGIELAEIRYTVDLPMSKKDNLIWLDLEMTGLEPEQHAIIEIGCCVTDGQLNVLAEGPVFALHQSEAELAKMDAWCVKQHGQSGLTERVRKSTITLADAEQKTLAFLKQHCEAGQSPLCGNSIGQDRRFLDKYMPTLNAFFHYRNVDVSTIKELVRRWYDASAQAPEKHKTHAVLDDIRESIEELRFYRRTIFKPSVL
jgi:oligoribonuclease